MVGLTSILREAWNTAANTEDKREKIQALSLAKEFHSTKSIGCFIKKPIAINYLGERLRAELE
jgi:hypothetical protein